MSKNDIIAIINKPDMPSLTIEDQLSPKLIIIKGFRKKVIQLVIIPLKVEVVPIEWMYLFSEKTLLIFFIFLVG